MRIFHPAIRNQTVGSSKGKFVIDAQGYAEVSDELGAHLLKLGYLDPTALPVKPANEPKKLSGLTFFGPKGEVLTRQEEDTDGAVSGVVGDDDRAPPIPEESLVAQLSKMEGPELAALRNNAMMEEAIASASLDKGDGQTHSVGDDCEGGHLTDADLAKSLDDLDNFKLPSEREPSPEDEDATPIADVVPIKKKVTAKKKAAKKAAPPKKASAKRR